MTIGRFLFAIIAALLAASQVHSAPAKATISAELNFKSLPAGQQAVLAIVADIPEGYHAQSHTPTEPTYIPFELKIDPNDAAEIFQPIYPKGQLETYQALGTLSVYTGKAIVYVPIQLKSTAQPGPLKFTGEVQYQMCDDKSCFARQHPKIEVETQIVAAGTPLEPNQPELFKGFDPSQFAKLATPAKTQAAAPKVTLFGVELTEGSRVFPYIAALLIGMIFNIMPCVLPVVPLKIMSFYQTAQHNRAQPGASLVFGLGITSVFAILGLLVVVLRWLDWGKLFGNPYFLIILIVLLLAFAAWQFGILKFILPTGIYNHMPEGETYLGNFLFGGFTAILSTPCTFGLFFGLLIWASAQSGIVGFTLLTTVGIGMALPYVVLSAFPEVARRFPRTGPWAELVKQIMGFLLVASAVFFARRFIVRFVGDEAFWWAMFAVVAATGIFLVLRTIQFSPRPVPRLVSIVLAALLVVPAFVFTYRQTNPPIKWRPYSAELVESERKSGKIVVLEFTAAWCGNCIALEASVFHDERTVNQFKELNVVPVRVDLTDEKAPGWKALSEISTVGAIPLTAVFSPNTPEPIQLAGLYSTTDLVNALSTASKGGVAAAR